MSHRQFKTCSAEYGGKLVPGIEIACGKCGLVSRYPRGTYKGTFIAPGSAEDAHHCEAIFKRNGWFVGKRPQEDRCPKCAAALGIEKPKTPAPPKNTVMEAKLKEAIAAHEAPKTAPQPREMTREEGRIIFAKLEEVYRDEKHGYQNDWSDHRVAADLNCPRAWVEEVRKKFFGPEGGNDEARKILAEAKALLTSAEQIRMEANKLIEFANEIGRKVEPIQRRIDHIQQIMGR